MRTSLTEPNLGVDALLDLELVLIRTSDDDADITGIDADKVQPFALELLGFRYPDNVIWLLFNETETGKVSVFPAVRV